MLSRYFVDRPIFAWVLAILVMIGGAISVATMGVEQFPDIAPPTISVNATYPGADAQTVENTVTQVLEQQLKGIDGLAYFTSASNNGSANIVGTFNKGVNPDIAQVQVQNVLTKAMSRLPTQVQTQGLQINKAQSDMLLLAGLYDTSSKSSVADLADYLAVHIVDPVSRINGVGSADIYGTQYAMRIWLDPTRLAAVKLMPQDVISALTAQNAQISAGEVGMTPSPATQRLNATITSRSRLQTSEQFGNVVLKTQVDGSRVLLKDVARVELGQENYASISKLDGYPAVGLAITLASGANAMTTAEAVKTRIAELSRDMPPGYRIVYPRDSSVFVKISIMEVVKTLIEAIVLVVVVMYVFLQNWRATLIPAIAVPVVLLGTFGILAAVGYTVNTLTMFGLVLAIGLLVDDAIVVVENVERVMSEDHLPPREATIRSMTEITPALIGISLVLAAVFIPMAFFGGSTGTIYRQFSITIVSAMGLSVLVALILTPALAGTLLAHVDGPSGRLFTGFNRRYDALQNRYQSRLEGFVRRPLPWFGVFLAICATAGWLDMRMQTSFLPEEDQANLFVSIIMPAGTTMEETRKFSESVMAYVRKAEAANIEHAFMVVGRNQSAGTAQNVAQGFITLKNWDERPGADRTAAAITQRLNAHLFQIYEGQAVALAPPAIRGLGTSAGFEMWLQDANGQGSHALTLARQDLMAKAMTDPKLAQIRFGGLEETPQLKVDIDDAAATAAQIAPQDINSTLSTAWGGTYVNDFIDRGRVKRVYVQGDAPFRLRPEDIGQWYVRSANGDMAPMNTVAHARWTTGSNLLRRFNGLPAQQIVGTGGPGVSSGAAMQEIARLQDDLGGGFTLAWSGLSYQQQVAANQAPALFAASILFIFLCLAALYESWSVPFSVMLVIPLGIIGAVLAATLRGLSNDIFFQVALLTTIGLSAKNAILIIEFAEAALGRGLSPLAAALEAARLRFRPIVMTSVAFIAGVVPLVLARGAGANGRQAIGTTVLGGMISATVLAVFFVPLFFIVVKGWFARTKKARLPTESAA
ncbi:hydrophobe/amphiphile efflux-1 HAE1 [Novosphingobium nitrogenifigens DSM 19370]|uniref:Efflux pump membrane transporter n=1 Tax=Novosphingobium nitrogenifigens DSM 19370 TaxID=983920 RepID=F1Z8I5_9SPHN|nr:efflux RND transporter permease subunit [Novosphingobium nitrogenifigens]EGD59040.1 hydrophobe/amphiphile efflux-1 HAE1 [Novosphingobium nitrogenifigens DSM 19370]